MPTLTERFEDFERVHLASLWSMLEFSQQLEARFGPEEGLEYCMWEVDRHDRDECKRERLLCPEMN